MLMSNSPDSYEEKEKKITALPEAQRLHMSLDEKDYPDHVIDHAHELVKKIALHDAGEQTEEDVKEIEDPRKWDDKKLESEHWKSMKEKSK